MTLKGTASRKTGEPSEDFLNARHGDVIEGRGVFLDGHHAIEWDVSSFKIVRPALKAGDRVTWWEDSAWRTGDVIGVEPYDKANDKHWVWVRPDATWPRRTFDAKELKRVHPPAKKTEAA